MPFPLAAVAAPFVIQGLSSAFRHHNRKKNRPPRFKDTARGKELKRIGTEGIISPTARRNMLAGQSQLLGTRANIRKTGLRGALEASGKGGSIAGLSLLDSVDAGTTKNLSDFTRGIQTRNELSKVGARRDFALGTDTSATARRNDNISRNQELFSGLSSALTGGIGAGVGAFEQGRSDEMFNADLERYQALIDAGDFEGADRLVTMMTLLEGR